MSKQKPNRTTVSKQLTLSPLAAGALGALEDLGVAGSAGAVVERILEDRVVGSPSYPDVWGIGAATVLRQRAAGCTPDEIAAEVRRVMVAVLTPGADPWAALRDINRPPPVKLRADGEPARTVEVCAACETIGTISCAACVKRVNSAAAPRSASAAPKMEGS